jgi:hypothetical protein
MMKQRHWHIDIDELRKLWDAGWLVEDLAKKYRVTNSAIYWLRKKYGIRDRDRQQTTEPAAPSQEDADASLDSLALSPWVAARAEEFRRQKEEKGEAVYSGVYLRTYSLRTMTVVAD